MERNTFRQWLWLLLACCCTQVQAQTQSRLTLARHPRLFYTPQRHTEALALIQRDKRYAQVLEDCQKAAKSLLTQPPVSYRLDIRGTMLNESRKAIGHVLQLGMAWRHSNDEALRSRLVTELDSLVAFPTWNPAHFLDVAEMTVAVATGYDWLYPTLTPAQRQKYERAILTKGITPYLTKFREGKDANVISHTHNWNLVCAGGILTGALAIGDLYPDSLESVWQHVQRRFPESMVHYNPDGAWFEGPGYWDYATAYAIIGCDAMLTATGSTQGLDSAPGFAKSALFYLQTTSPGGYVFNFADAGSDQPTINPQLLWLSRQYNQPAAAEGWLQRRFKRLRVFNIAGARLYPLALAWAPATSTANFDRALLAPEDKVYQGPVPLITLYDSGSYVGTRDDVFFMAKGGNSQLNHQQLDIGTFYYEYGGVPFFVDLGADNYALPEFWGRKPGATRWRYLRNNNRSHSTLIIGDTTQNPLGVGTLSALQDSAGRKYASIDMTTAYQPLARKVIRTVGRDGRTIRIHDYFEVQPALPVEWQAVIPSLNVQIDGNKVRLSRGGKTIVMTGPKKTQWVLRPLIPTTHPDESHNEGYARLVLRGFAAKEQHIKVTITPDKSTDRIIPTASLF